MSNEVKDSVSVSPLCMTAMPSRATQFISEREGNLPTWMRAPKRGREFSRLTYLVNANNITSDVYDRFRN